MEVLALSSGESELGALVKACAEGIGVQSLLSDFGINVQLKILSDATAAIGMVRRLGLGRVRHLATADLWVQQKLREGKFSVAKHPGVNNGTDLMTTVKGRHDLVRLLGLMGFAPVQGRSSIAPLRAKLWNVGMLHRLLQHLSVRIRLVIFLIVVHWNVTYHQLSSTIIRPCAVFSRGNI